MSIVSGHLRCRRQLRAVLTNANAPNSIPPERVFSILNLNDSWEDDQTRAHADLIEHSLQSQYNGRGRHT